MKPEIYELSTTTEIRIAVVDADGVVVVPEEARLTIDVPDGTSVTVSGAGLILGDGYLSYQYLPAQSGYYYYEAWVKDNQNRESSKTHGFVVTDRIS